jgi:hypothetical protein
MKQVTVLFCDIVNSTPLTERLDQLFLEQLALHAGEARGLRSVLMVPNTTSRRCRYEIHQPSIEHGSLSIER